MQNGPIVHMHCCARYACQRWSLATVWGINKPGFSYFFTKMSDANRKGLFEQAKEAIIPDSQKSTGEKTKESVTSGFDNAQSSAQPDETKGTFQQASDKVKDSF